jgi:hypothetical protein
MEMSIDDGGQDMKAARVDVVTTGREVRPNRRDTTVLD